MRYVHVYTLMVRTLLRKIGDIQRIKFHGGDAPGREEGYDILGTDDMAGLLF